MNWKKDGLYSHYVSTQAPESKNKDDEKVLQAYFGKFLPKDKDARILDVGCGSGGFINWLHQLGYENAKGVDISKEQVRLGKEKGVEGIVEEDARSYLKKYVNEFDAIFMRDFLEHFTRKEALNLMSDARKALTRNGYVVCQTVNGESLLAGRLRYGDLTHETAYTWRSARQLCLLVGLSEPEVYPQRPIVKGMRSLVRFCVWMGVEAGLRVYLLAAAGTGQGIFTQDILFKAKK